MARPFLCAGAVGALLLIAIPLLVAAGPDDEPRVKEQIEISLAVQRALNNGQEQLQHGQFQAAIEALEREVDRVNDKHVRKEYLQALETAYRGYISELQQAHRDEEAKKYVKRLEALDPGSRLEQRKPPTIGAMASQTQTPVRQPEVRGAYDHKAVETDPFSDANRAPRDVRTILARANQEFSDKHYQNAGQLFQEANALDPNATAPYREFWAYCKMSCVVDALNQSDVPATALEDLKSEVRLAMTMAAPRLDEEGKKLLRSLKDRAALSGKGSGPSEPPHVEEAAIEMRHLGRQGQWSVLETPHFRIYHTQPHDVAENAAKIAEQTYKVASKKWFGDNGEVWNRRCDMFLYASAQDYNVATGVPVQSPGHSTIQSEGELVRSRTMHIHCDDPNWSIGVLPHETTHVVVAGRYGKSEVPKWADEGMAVLSEPRERIDRHLRNLPKHRDEQMLFSVRTLMEMKDYPKPQYIGPFYAQSVSLVEYLSSLKGPQTYTAFLRDGLRSGYEPALKKHFGIEGYADLERRWQTAAFSQQSAAADMPR